LLAILWKPNKLFWLKEVIFIFSISDGEYSSSADVSVTITAVNDAPVLATVSDVSFDEDESGSTSLSGSDVDGDDLTYSITGGTDITAELTGSDVTFSVPQDYNGSESFSVSVTDGEYIDSQIITVTVNAVNDAPIATTGLLGSTNEDQSMVISLSGSDIDGDILEYSISENPENGSVALDGSLVTYAPNSNFNGSDSFIFAVSDGEYSSSADVTVSIAAVNDAQYLQQYLMSPLMRMVQIR